MIEDILVHAREYPNQEICGVIIVFKGREKYIRCRNISETNASDHFLLDPEDYMKAEDMGEITYIVHSHPFTPSEPSTADLLGIERTGIPWIIVNPSTGNYSITKPSGFRLPFVGRRFDHGVVDCYALFKDYYREKLNIELPEFYREDAWWHKGKKLYRDNYKNVGFYEVSLSEIKEHDGMIMCNGSSEPNHIAVYLGNSKILHHVQGRLSSIDVFGGMWQQNLWKVIRYKDLK